MPRYFFHVREAGHLVVKDAEGVVLLDDADARSELWRLATEVLAEGWDVRPSDDRAFEIVTEDGELILVVPFNGRPNDRP